MQPSSNSFLPFHQQKASQSTPSVGNSCPMLPNSMQVQPQMGIINPHLPIPFANSSNMPPLMPQAGFMNAPAHPFHSQNNNLGTPQLTPVGAVSQPGFGVPILNNALMGQLCNPMQNPTQAQGQLIHGLANLTQQLNQIMALATGQQFSMQNQVQNMNQFVPMQMPIPQGAPYGAPLGSQQLAGFGGSNFFGNPQFGVVNSKQTKQHLNKNWGRHGMNSPQSQGNSFGDLSSSTKPQQNQNSQHSGITSSQGQPIKAGHINNLCSNRKNFQGKTFPRNLKSHISQKGFQKSQFHQSGNGKRKFGSSNDHKGKGPCNERPTKLRLCDSANVAKEMKRCLALPYTEKEIQQWREERKKNYPSKANIQKKLNKKLADSGDSEAKIRREQLKEILSKQAELGVEVAEVPSHYFSDSEKQGGRGNKNGRALTKRRGSKNKQDIRGRNNKNDKSAKQERLRNPSNNSCLNKREPTLLQKLLSADVKRERCHLLQVFRFVVMNSFFKDGPDKLLKFPKVVVKESGCEEKSTCIGEDVSDSSKKIVLENVVDSEDVVVHDKDASNDEGSARVEQAAGQFVKREELIDEEIGRPGGETEEGEIID